MTATKSVLPLIASRHLRQGAFVCDVSRPFNIVPDLSKERTDIRWIDGGLVRAPEPSTLEFLEEPDRHNVLVACAAETIILALSGFSSQHLCGRLEIATIEEVGRVADKMGFSPAS